MFLKSFSLHHNRRLSPLNGMSYVRIYDFLRPLNRLFIGRVRLLSLIFIFTVIFVYIVRILQPPSSSSTDFMLTHDFDEHLTNIKDDLQYAVMIDAGSSGSRVHIYVWPPHTGDPRQLLKIRMLHNDLGKDVYSKIIPGLSSCASDPSSASKYIDPLLKFASNHIPVHKHRETPLFILATAGMRLLPLETQNAILDNLRLNIPKNYSFLFSSNHCEVITGKEEGIYSWIAINYLMSRFDHSLNGGPITTIDLVKGKITTRTRTIGMLEMGGASVQIAYEVTSKYQYKEIKEQIKAEESLKSVVSEFNLGCLTHDSDHNYRLFVTTYLGLGTNVARSSYVNSLISSTIDVNAVTSLETKVINLYDPCLCIDSTENVNITRRTKGNNSSTTFMYMLKGTGDFNACESKLRNSLDFKLESSKMCYKNTNTKCPLTQLHDTRAPFDNSEFYGFSEFWYTTDDILGLGGIYSYNKFHSAALQYCATSWSVLKDRQRRKLYPLADNDRLMYQCFKSAWISAVLHDGFKMPKSYAKYKSALTVNDEQIQWTLGALLYRTRFFPLRAIEQHYNSHTKANHNYGTYYVNYTLFIICMIAVFICILIYLRHLHIMVNDFNVNRCDMNLDNSMLKSIVIMNDEVPLIDNIK